jgi:glycerophosphoryl diester phosphodiesterase
MKLAHIIMPLAAFVAAGCSSLKEPAFDTLIAHRGESKDAPENTMAAFRMACERGFGFECDVYLSKDKELFTFHDVNLSRTTGGVHTERCIDADWHDTVSKVNVAGWGKWKGSKFDPSRPALLSEVLTLARDGRYIYVEVKGFDDPSWVPYIKKEIEKAENVNPGNVLFITFGKKLAAALKKAMPQYRTYWLTAAYTQEINAKGEVVRKAHTAEEIIDILNKLGVDGLDIMFDPDVVDAQFVRKVKDAGFSFHVWTVDDIEKAKAAFALGADTLTTNRAKWLLEEYNKKKD